MSDTPETDAQITIFKSVSKLGKHFTNKKGTVSANFARKLERERNAALNRLKEIELLWEEAQYEMDEMI